MRNGYLNHNARIVWATLNWMGQWLEEHRGWINILKSNYAFPFEATPQLVMSVVMVATLLVLLAIFYAMIRKSRDLGQSFSAIWR